jgi:hypothetical protein
MPTRKSKARTLKPNIEANPMFSKIRFIRANTSRFREAEIDEFLTLLFHPRRLEIIGIELSDVMRFAQRDLIFDEQADRPLSFERLVDLAREFANDHSSGTEEECDLRNKVYAIAKQVVGKTKIPNAKLKGMVY